MAQWDVYVNPSSRLREDMPYLVELQSDLLDGLPTRLVAPLIRSRMGLNGLPRGLCPDFQIEGVAVVLIPYESGSIETRLLKRPVASLRSHAHDIVAALDAVIAGV